MILGLKLGRATPDRSSWPTLLLMLIAVLAPTACVLWFMNQAVNREREIVRQRLGEAYRGQLALLSDRLDGYWEQRAGDLGRRTSQEAPAQVFERKVTAGLADSIIYLDADGSVLYPS